MAPATVALKEKRSACASTVGFRIYAAQRRAKWQKCRKTVTDKPLICMA